MPRRCSFALVFALAFAQGCATSRNRSAPEAMGGSVMDFDRGDGVYSPRTAGIAGSPETIGSPDWRRDVDNVPPAGMEEPAPRVVPRDTLEPEPHAAATPTQDRPLIAGPIEAGRRATDPDIVRALQTALKSKGYYQGDISGAPNAALTDALRRYQIDQRLPATGTLDAETARRAGVPSFADRPETRLKHGQRSGLVGVRRSRPACWPSAFPPSQQSPSSPFPFPSARV